MVFYDTSCIRCSQISTDLCTKDETDFYRAKLNELDLQNTKGPISIFYAERPEHGPFLVCRELSHLDFQLRLYF